MSLIHLRRPRSVRTRTCSYGPAGSGSPTPDPAPDGRRPGRSAAPSAPTVALRARRGLLGLYLLLGMTMSSWLARLPTVRAELGLSTGELGTILLLGAVGSLVTLLGAGAVAVRWGSVNTLVAAAAVFSVANLLLGLGPAAGSVAVLTVGVVLLSMSFALGNVPMNLETVAIERAMRRTVVPQFHAAFSVGSVLGSGVGAAAAWGQVPLIVQFGVISVVSLVWRLRAIPRAVLAVAEPKPSVRSAGETAAAVAPASRRAALRDALGAWRERRTIVIGVVVMAAALSEGSANNWLAIGVVDGFARTEAVAALVFGVFVASMTVARLVGTAVLDRYGRVAVLSASGLTGLVGVAVFGLGPNLPLAVVGVVCWGLGTGLIVPIGIAAVSADPMKAAGRVAVVSAFASGASLAAPPLIGVVAEHVGVRNALLFVCVGMVAATLLAREAGAGHQPSVPSATAETRPGEAQADEARIAETPTPSGTDAVRPTGPTAGDGEPVRTEPALAESVSTVPVPVVVRARHRHHGWSGAHAVRRTARALAGQVRR